MSVFDPLFRVFLKYRNDWSAQVGWFQRISQPVNGEYTLRVQGDLVQKGERGSRVTGNSAMLSELNELGLLKDLTFS